MALDEVQEIHVPSTLVAATEENLRAAGKQGYELFVLWSGRQLEHRFDVMALHVPRQTSIKEHSGLCVRVEGDALHQLNQWLFEAGQTLAVQIHSHPGRAYHSETDDTSPIVTSIGALSVVVARFCEYGFLSKSTAIYRLTRSGWDHVSSPASDLFMVRANDTR